MRRTTCGSCGWDRLHQFLDLGTSPLADAYTASSTDEVERYPLQLAVCEKCMLVQLLEVVDSETLFGTGYSFYSSASPPLSSYHHLYAEQVMKRHDNLTRRLVVEVGCNDGDMLRWFKALGCPTVGIDPALGPAKVAESRGLNVWKTAFTAATAREMLETHGRAGVVIANHVLAHVADVSDFLHGVSLILASDGVAFIEVQYLPDMLVNNAFDLIYHEHRNFFSLASLATAAERWGLRVVDVQLTRRQGGSLRVTLKRGAVEQALALSLVEAEWWLKSSGFAAYDGMQGRVERIRTRLWDLLAEQSGTIAGYGAPAKATTLLNYCGIDEQVLDFIVDTTPAKQGRFVPGTGIPIVAPDDARQANSYLLLAHNYANEIMMNHRPINTRWILPIPSPMVL